MFTKIGIEIDIEIDIDIDIDIDIGAFGEGFAKYPDFDFDLEWS